MSRPDGPYSVTAGPHCRRKVRLSHKSETVSLLWDSLTFLRQCGQAFSLLFFGCVYSSRRRLLRNDWLFRL